ncbi:MAG: glycosyltransferase family 4 protein [Pyrinomonadaceae bacterium]
MKPLAIVIPWFGAKLIGGAEQQAWQLAARLTARGHSVEVLTTCGRSFQDDWSHNHHAPGLTIERGVHVRRFPVEARDAEKFDAVNRRLLALAPEDLRSGVCPVPEKDARVFVAENVKSSALLEHLRARRDDYRAFVFLPYMFGPITQGLPLVAERAYLQPCLHDEPQAYFPQVAALFRAARGLLFNSEGERRLALRLYGPGIFRRARVGGEGVEPTTCSPEEIERALPAKLRGAPFVLYLGRRDPTKNVALLARAFARFKASTPGSELRLVLAGPGELSFNDTQAGIHDLGLVGEDVKAALLARARALFQPSRRESFSRALLEAWLAGRPAAVHRKCMATASAVAESGGGWVAADEAEWAALFSRVAAADETQLRDVGASGQIYAARAGDWEHVLDRYEEIFGLTHNAGESAGSGFNGRQKAEDGGVEESVGPIPPPPDVRRGSSHSSFIIHHSSFHFSAVHQLLPDLAHGDAIGNQSLALREELRAAGFASEIYAKRVEDRLRHEASLVDESEIEPGAALVYHHSIGSDVTALALAHRGPKCLVYHNITPAEFYAPYRPGFAWMLEVGRAGLPGLAPHFPVSVGDSRFNADELAARGFHAPGVLPIIVNPDKWNIEPDARLSKQLQDGRTNVLYVCRVVPNKGQDELVQAFAHYLALDPTARLFIAGISDSFDPYCRRVRETVRRLGLGENVFVTGRIDDAELLAYYRTAHLYWAMSEHEGFGVPLVEAMWHDVPMLAHRSAATPETLGGAGVTFERKEDLPSIAALAHRLVHDEGLRREVLAAQAARRLAFTPEAVREILAELLDKLERSPVRREVA